MSVAEFENDAARSFQLKRAFGKEHNRRFGGSAPAASWSKLRNARIGEIGQGCAKQSGAAGEGARATLLRGFQQALFRFFLARDAMAGPGHGFEALGVDLFAARNAFSEAAFADASQSAIHHVEQLAVVIALT